MTRNLSLSLSPGWFLPGANKLAWGCGPVGQFETKISQDQKLLDIRSYLALVFVALCVGSLPFA